MPRTRIGEVTGGERDEILRLHERRTALKELFLTLNSPYLSSEERDALEKGIVEDLARTNALFDGWWRAIGAKYQLERGRHGQTVIDFQTRELWHEPSPEGQSCEACAPNDTIPV
jgi:CXXX repeat modification system protein